MNKFIKYIFIIGLFCLAGILNPVKSYSQGAPADPGCDPLDPACPIDGGLSLLIAAGIGIGMRNAYKTKGPTTKI